jgi:uncharacterized membrane protein
LRATKKWKDFLFFLCSGIAVKYGSNTKEYSITKDGQKNDRDASQ